MTPYALARADHHEPYLTAAQQAAWDAKTTREARLALAALTRVATVLGATDADLHTALTRVGLIASPPPPLTRSCGHPAEGLYRIPTARGIKCRTCQKKHADLRRERRIAAKAGAE